MIAEQGLQRVVVTRDAAGTRALAGALAAAARAGDLISLIGDLGAGKTQFAKGFGAGLGITDTIVSPSFVLMAEYRGRLPLFHADLYRLADAAEAFSGGLIDDRQVEGVTLIEWAERLADAMPDERLDVLIDGSGDDPRTITLRPGDASYARYLDLVPAGVEAGDQLAGGADGEPGESGHVLAVVAEGGTAETARGGQAGTPLAGGADAEAAR